MPLTDEHLAYFRRLLAGEPVEPWHRWWAVHEPEMKALPRADYLRLKFHKLKAAAEFLGESGIPFSWSNHARVAAVFANYTPEALGEDGLLRPEFRRKLVGGAVGLAEDGDLDGARRRFKREIGGLRKLPEVPRARELEELEFLGEHLLLESNPIAGQLLLEAVAGWGTGDDLTDPAVFAARKALEPASEHEDTVLSGDA